MGVSTYHLIYVPHHLYKRLESAKPLWYSIFLLFRRLVNGGQPPKNSEEFMQMTPKKRRFMAYGVAALLLVIALVCYAAFSKQAPEEPVRIMYQTQVGKVLFDHKTHAGQGGYALDCYDCHHHTPDDESGLIACKECHTAEPQEGVIAEGCLECHDETEVEDSEYPKHTDALHQQCWQCHEEYEQGPSSSPEDCAQCHVL